MRIGPIAAVALLIAVATSDVLTQAPAQSPDGPTFDVVSIRRNTAGTNSGFNERPDGGFTVTNATVTGLIRRAYPAELAASIVGVPDWASSERFDVSATSSLAQATAADKIAMMRAMLADRFKLAAHIEPREQQVYDLVLARGDGRLGSGLKRYEEDIDCEARMAAERAAAAAAKAASQAPPRLDLNASPPPCQIYFRGAQGSQMEGKIPMAGFAQILGGTAGRPVIDKTGLTGLYHIMMEYDRMAAIRGPALADTPGAAPSVFIAVQEQLGLKLEPSRAMRDTLVIDRLERPTEN
jgi:uncharacterized protein (TIGR03435 family)